MARRWIVLAAMMLTGAVAAPYMGAVASHSGSHALERPVLAGTLREGAYASWHDFDNSEEQLRWDERAVLVWRHEAAAAGEGATGPAGETSAIGGVAASVKSCTREIIQAPDGIELGEERCGPLTVWRAEPGDESVVFRTDPTLSAASLVATLRGPAGECSVNLAWSTYHRADPQHSLSADGSARAEVISQSYSNVNGESTCGAEPGADTGNGVIWRATDVAITP